MKIRSLLVIAPIVASMLFGSNAYSEGFKSFYAESDRATEGLHCKNTRVNSASYGFGALYSCILGRKETVKWFINETPNTNQVENIKFIWNDWFKDMGFGLHADSQEAQKALDVLTDFYAPQKKEVLKNAFWGEVDRKIESENYILEYTYFRGPAIDERMIVVIQKK